MLCSAMARIARYRLQPDDAHQQQAKHRRASTARVAPSKPCAARCATAGALQPALLPARASGRPAAAASKEPSVSRSGRSSMRRARDRSAKAHLHSRAHRPRAAAGRRRCGGTRCARGPTTESIKPGRASSPTVFGEELSHARARKLSSEFAVRPGWGTGQQQGVGNGEPAPGALFQRSVWSLPVARPASRIGL